MHNHQDVAIGSLMYEKLLKRKSSPERLSLTAPLGQKNPQGKPRGTNQGASIYKIPTLFWLNPEIWPKIFSQIKKYNGEPIAS